MMASMPAGQIALGLLVGILAGAVHFMTLHWNVRLFTRGLPGKAFALQIARLAVLAVVFLLLAKWGAAALLAGGLGLLAARHAVVRRLGMPR